MFPYVSIDLPLTVHRNSRMTWSHLHDLVFVHLDGRIDEEGEGSIRGGHFVALPFNVNAKASNEWWLGLDGSLINRIS